MATHGTILIQKKDQGKVILHTTHDGHTDEALKLLLLLPDLVAKDIPWFLRLLSKYGDDQRDKIADTYERTIPFEWSILEVAHAIAFQHYNRWLVTPLRWLSERDRDPEITVNLNSLSPTKLTMRLPEFSNQEDYNEFMEGYLEILVEDNKNRPENCRATSVKINGDKPFTGKIVLSVPYYERYIEALYQLSRDIKKPDND